jgi:hypothetical protein
VKALSAKGMHRVAVGDVHGPGPRERADPGEGASRDLSPRRMQPFQGWGLGRYTPIRRASPDATFSSHIEQALDVHVVSISTLIQFEVATSYPRNASPVVAGTQSGSALPVLPSALHLGRRLSTPTSHAKALRHEASRRGRVVSNSTAFL